jgi:hypothetical protein
MVLVQLLLLAWEQALEKTLAPSDLVVLAALLQLVRVLRTFDQQTYPSISGIRQELLSTAEVGDAAVAVFYKVEVALYLEYLHLLHSRPLATRTLAMVLTMQTEHDPSRLLEPADCTLCSRPLCLSIQSLHSKQSCK